MRDKSKYIWYEIYCYVIPTVVLAGYICFWIFASFRAAETEYFKDVCLGTVTFVSITLSLFGVLLTVLISLKEKSQMVQYFLQNVKGKSPMRLLKQIILSGLLTIMLLLTFLLLSEIQPLSSGLFGAVIWFLMFFSCSMFRFINILIHLVFDKPPSQKSFQNPMSEQDRVELNKRIEHMK